MPLLPGTDGVQKMSKSLGNHDRRSPTRRTRCTARRCRIPDAALPQWYELLLGARRRRASARATPSARSRARSWRASTARRRPRRPRRRFERVFVAHELPEEIEEAVVRPPTAAVHLPELIADGFRRLALGGAADDGPGRREARRRAGAPTCSTCRRPTLDGRVLQVGKRHFRRLRVA